MMVCTYGRPIAYSVSWLCLGLLCRVRDPLQSRGVSQGLSQSTCLPLPSEPSQEQAHGQSGVRARAGRGGGEVRQPLLPRSHCVAASACRRCRSLGLAGPRCLRVAAVTANCPVRCGSAGLGSGSAVLTPAVVPD